MFGSRTYEARVKGSIEKQLVCEHCQAQFRYVLTREALGSATGVLGANSAILAEKARHMANAALQAMLQREHDAVACPGCGLYQPFMIPLVRKTHHRWMVLIGAFFLIIAANCGGLWAACRFSGDAEVVANASTYGNAALWMGNIGLGIILLRQALALGVSPNFGDPEQRKRTTKAVLILPHADDLENHSVQ